MDGVVDIRTTQDAKTYLGDIIQNETAASELDRATARRGVRVGMMGRKEKDGMGKDPRTFRIVRLYSNIRALCVEHNNDLCANRIAIEIDGSEVGLPLLVLLTAPENASLALEVSESKHDRSLCSLIRCLNAISFGHVCVDISWATRIDQDGAALLFLGKGQCSGCSNQPSLGNGIGCRWKSSFLLLSSLNGGSEVSHDACDIGLGLRCEKTILDLVRVFVGLSCCASHIYHAPTGFDKGKESMASLQGFVVITVERCIHDL
jgi:hypothetical protein